MDFIAEVHLTASLEAAVNKCILTVSQVDSKLALTADRELLLSAVGNLVQNAFKFTHRGTEVRLNAYARADRILIEVEDKCGGIPQMDLEEIFAPFIQKNTDRSGLGLGLSIARRSIEANKGTLDVRNIPGSGCIFTVDMPGFVMPDPPPELGAAS